MPHATVKMRVDGEERLEHGTGDGMVDACYKVIAQIVGQQPTLERYLVNAITGEAPRRKVKCLACCATRSITATGQGVHTDIIMASALAYINALQQARASTPTLSSGCGARGPERRSNADGDERESPSSPAMASDRK